jgi:hypothetical protein
MWDPTEFYDDMEHSIFKIMLTCGTKIGLWRYYGAYGVTKQAWNRERSTTVPSVMTKVFLSLNLLGSEILWRYYPGTSQNNEPKCGCVTNQRFSCSADLQISICRTIILGTSLCPFIIPL